MENVTELYNEVANRAKDLGVADQQAWDEMVEEVVEEYRSQGLTEEDDDTEGGEEELKAMFSRYYSEIRGQE
jgi:SMC interacting uncharacterized protein involved in chromosome segregation